MALNLAGNNPVFFAQEFKHFLNGLMKKIFGKGSANTEIYFLANMIVVTASGVLTSQDKFLADSNNDDLIKQYRYKALKAGQSFFTSEIKKKFDSISIEDIYYDLNVEKDTSIIILILHTNKN